MKNYSKLKIAVTGGAGFIGSHLVDAYLAQGFEVHVIDNFSTGRIENKNSNAIYHQIDIVNSEAVNNLFAEHKFDLLNHHAAQLNVRVSVANPKFDAEQNIIGGINVLQAACNNECNKVVFASSAGTVYGEQIYFPADEAHPNNPISPYGIAKFTIEKFLHYFKVSANLNYVSLRYTNVFGPRQNPHGESGVIAIFCQQMLSNINPIMTGTGLQTRDYVFVSDVVNANMVASKYLLSGNEIGDYYNVCTQKEITLVEVFEVLNSFYENKFEKKYSPAKIGEQQRSYASYEKIKNKFGWEPHRSLSDGLRDCLEYSKLENL